MNESCEKEIIKCCIVFNNLILLYEWADESKLKIICKVVLYAYIFHGRGTLIYHCGINSNSIFKQILNYLNYINFLFIRYEALITSYFFAYRPLARKVIHIAKIHFAFHSTNRPVLLYKQFHKVVAM